MLSTNKVINAGQNPYKNEKLVPAAQSAVSGEINRCKDSFSTKERDLGAPPLQIPKGQTKTFVGRANVSRARKRAGAPAWLQKLERQFANLPGLPEVIRPNIPQVKEPVNPQDPKTLPEGVEKKALIVGGGIAGLSTALELADRGYSVTIREASNVLGGRLDTRQKETDAGTFAVEHGLHMWFDNYHVFREIRDRLDINDEFRGYKEVHFQFRTYKPETLKSAPPIYPINLLRLLQRSPNMNLLDGLANTFGLLDVMNYNHDKTFEKYDNMSVEEWIKEKGITKKFYELFIQPAASVTLNDPSKMSAAEMIQMMHEYFVGQPRAMDREVVNNDHYRSVIGPWEKELKRLGVTIETKTPVRGLEIKDGKIVGEKGKNENFDWVVMATEPKATKKILAQSVASDGQSIPALESAQKIVEPMKSAPPFSVLRVWLDKQTNADRPDVIEPPQHEPINLVAQFHLLENESADWAKKTKGSVLELHLYNTPEYAGKSKEEIWKDVQPTFLELLPELKDAKVLGSTITRGDNFTSYEPGQATARPMADSLMESGKVENLAFAGDWVNTDYPCALMERAVATGREAANALLVRDGVQQAPVPFTRKYGPGFF